ncbi:unnamed protein product [Notodromas monacha]|uniref:Alpha 1,4-glycosyltransferase domain-containing protein n=1 Tax=Notodromas monacha TaxID=399045 RepID=A0A7R9C1G6_9CRUS|nr:unnamed protein product [Notodromas monacha]CAG0924562.1 unnamed protein product [Notodromas monacha]
MRDLLEIRAWRSIGRRRIRQKIFIGGCFMAVLLAFRHFSGGPESDSNSSQNDKKSSSKPEPEVVNSKLDLRNISAEDFAKNSIYLLETSGRQFLSPKQLCCVESAARYNPKKQIVVLSTADALLYPTLATSIARNHSNIIFRRVDVAEAFRNSPLKSMDINSTLKQSMFVTEHTSDLLRLVLLYEHGGTYMDFDMIVLKELPKVANGVATADDGKYLANGFLIFEKGHPVMLDCLTNIAKSFNKNWFNGNGPDRITEAMQRWCNTSTLQPGMNCSNVYLFPVDNFTHLNWGIAMTAFDEDPAISDPLVANLESKAFVFHYYNDLTRVVDASITGNSAIARMARKYCPLVTSYSRDWLWGFHDPGKGFQ